MSSADTNVTGAEESQPEVDEGREALVAELRGLIGDGLVEHFILPGRDLWIRVAPEAWQHTATSLRTAMGARHFGFLSAIDWMPSPFGRSMDSAVDKLLAVPDTAAPEAASDQPEPSPASPGVVAGYAGGATRFQVFARVANLTDRWALTVKVDVGDDSPSVDTWTRVYAGADWHEREAWEMFGINFVGHRGLRHIYLPTEFEGNPLRKDFPLLARMVKPWPGIVDVEPMPGAGDESDPAEGEAAAGQEEAS